MNGVYNAIILLMWWNYLTSKRGEKNITLKTQIEKYKLSDMNSVYWVIQMMSNIVF